MTPIRLYGYAAALLAGLALGAAGGWSVQGWRLGAEVAQIKQERSDQETTGQRAAREKEHEHAQAGNINEAQLIEDLKQLAGAQARRAADASRRAAEYQRLRDNARSREATTRAWAQAQSTARDDLADRLVTLEGHIERGVGVVEEGLAVVGRLEDAVEQRDVEIAAQQRQIDIDRALIAEDAKE